jgi:hypothetical protein
MAARRSWERLIAVPDDDRRITGQDAILVTAEQHLRQAQAALADGDSAEASARGQEMLRQVEDLLDCLSSPHETDPKLWSTAVGLRDDFGGYLLAATTLQETGVSPAVVIDILRRGAAFAEDVLERLSAGAAERQTA